MPQRETGQKEKARGGSAAEAKAGGKAENAVQLSFSPYRRQQAVASSGRRRRADSRFSDTAAKSRRFAEKAGRVRIFLSLYRFAGRDARAKCVFLCKKSGAEVARRQLLPYETEKATGRTKHQTKFRAKRRKTAGQMTSRAAKKAADALSRQVLRGGAAGETTKKRQGDLSGFLRFFLASAGKA